MAAAVAVRHSGGRYRPAPAFRDAVVDSAPRRGSHDFAQIVDELLVRTHKRSYLGVVRAGHLVVILEHGHQGMPRMPAWSRDPRQRARAGARHGGARARAAARYLAGRLEAFTPHTITRPGPLHAELAAIRRTGIGADREESGVPRGLPLPGRARRRRPRPLPRRGRHLDEQPVRRRPHLLEQSPGSR